MDVSSPGGTIRRLLGEPLVRVLWQRVLWLRVLPLRGLPLRVLANRGESPARLDSITAGGVVEAIRGVREGAGGEAGVGEPAGLEARPETRSYHRGGRLG